MLAGALSAKRIPIPEPSVFSEDPMTGNSPLKPLSTRRTFKTRRRYTTSIDMQVDKKALNDYLLLRTESAYGRFWRTDTETHLQLRTRTETSFKHGPR